jgi:hypothetical protein
VLWHFAGHEATLPLKQPQPRAQGRFRYVIANPRHMAEPGHVSLAQLEVMSLIKGYRAALLAGHVACCN